MSTLLENLFKTEEEVKENILSDFASELLIQMESLVSVYGKEKLMQMTLKNENKESTNITSRIV